MHKTARASRPYYLSLRPRWNSVHELVRGIPMLHEARSAGNSLYPHPAAGERHRAQRHPRRTRELMWRCTRYAWQQPLMHINNVRCKVRTTPGNFVIASRPRPRGVIPLSRNSIIFRSAREPRSDPSRRARAEGFRQLSRGNAEWRRTDSRQVERWNIGNYLLTEAANNRSEFFVQSAYVATWITCVRLHIIRKLVYTYILSILIHSS